jgi:hypothetical protein
MLATCIATRGVRVCDTRSVAPPCVNARMHGTLHDDNAKHAHGQCMEAPSNISSSPPEMFGPLCTHACTGTCTRTCACRLFRVADLTSKWLHGQQPAAPAFSWRAHEGPVYCLIRVEAGGHATYMYRQAATPFGAPVQGMAAWGGRWGTRPQSAVVPVTSCCSPRTLRPPHACVRA